MVQKISIASALILATAGFCGTVFPDPKDEEVQSDSFSRMESDARPTPKYRGMRAGGQVITDVPGHADELDKAKKIGLEVDATSEPRAPEDTMK